MPAFLKLSNIRTRGNRWCRQWYGLHMLQHKCIFTLSNRSRNLRLLCN